MEDYKELDTRLSKLEEWKHMIDISRAREEVDRVYIDKRFDGLERTINEFKSAVKWALYLIAGTLMTAYLLPFLLSGKLVGVN
jgi:hypothetical protein